MNIFGSESDVVVAKTCGCKGKGKQKVTYAFDTESHYLCFDKKDIILAELEACETLLLHSTSEPERAVVQKEITNLKYTLDLLT
jgi:hypothetical protein